MTTFMVPTGSWSKLIYYDGRIGGSLSKRFWFDRDDVLWRLSQNASASTLAIAESASAGYVMCREANLSTLILSLEQTASRFPERGITVLQDRRRAMRLSYSDLLLATREGAAKWSTLGVVPGDRILLSLPTSWELIHAWLGAICCGALPIAAAPLQPFGDVRVATTKLHGLARFLRARCVVASEAMVDQFASASNVLTAAQWTRATRHPSAVVQARGSDIAFLQLTSGTSAVPRAVEISHRAAIHNTIALYDAISLTGPPIATVVSWLPLHHDMGLVGALLLSIVIGCELCLIPPKLFLAWPQLWFERIAASDGVLALSPNFGLQHCIDRKERFSPGLNLAGWRATVCGGEMLRPDTLFGFMATYDVRPDMLRPGYGLAEATLAVTLDRAGRGPRTRPAPRHTMRRFALADVVCLGEPVSGTELRIASPNGRPIAEGREGEVLVRGPGLFSGYFADSDATQRSLRDGWLRTGDLGFMRDGELYVTGRRDDRLILHGATINPHDIEWIAEELTAGGEGCRAAAFSIACGDRGEQAILVVETRERDPLRLETIEVDIRERVAKRMALQLAHLAFVRRGQLPRTTSGKIRRAAARELYLRGAMISIDVS
jgi:acyl-CoA synthetase (AMP-forming)/AMP-acid ligase II